MVRRIREVLCLQAKSSAAGVELAAFAARRPVERISSVELNAGLGREHLEQASACRFERFGGELKVSFTVPFQNPSLVVAHSEFKLLIVLVYSRANGRRFPKIKWSSGDGAYFASRNQTRIYGQKSLGVNQHLMIRDFLVGYT
jgi:hypothetical protein